MKKMLLLLTAAVLSAAAQAQTTPPANGGYQQGRGMGRGQDRTPEQRADLQTRRLTNQLALSAEQQPKVRAIFLAQATEMDAARAQLTPGSVDREAMRRKLQEGRARYDEQLRAVLTPEQLTRYQQLREDQVERAGQLKEVRQEGQVKTRKAKTKGQAD